MNNKGLKFFYLQKNVISDKIRFTKLVSNPTITEGYEWWNPTTYPPPRVEEEFKLMEIKVKENIFNHITYNYFLRNYDCEYRYRVKVTRSKIFNFKIKFTLETSNNGKWYKKIEIKKDKNLPISPIDIIFIDLHQQYKRGIRLGFY